MSDPERPNIDPSEEFGRIEGWAAFETIMDTLPEYRSKSLYALFNHAIDFALEGQTVERTDIDRAKAAEALAKKFDESFRNVFGSGNNEVD
jgi:hypothetical protein